ncbi:hypothetical protein JX265_005747 [Neoarthrinium moseri]|uniref:Cytochrome P450 n=1 Tax=Neoarthrinium moseri TaxID=1658444 RepID=A0A9P9WN55_9PEZI|nr:uncharacterized protein JN550_012276 [Neoarthrinium moseri]KAI1858918.1 hypothetical protein JN550_012276 [Neoarthrinium moseri]KAI1871761.1 hypothetical protein JX265_005747 [Neoarthrinium moseri]
MPKTSFDHDGLLSLLQVDRLGDTKISPYTVVVAICVSFLWYRLLRNKFKNGLADLPGPPLASWTRFWMLWDVNKGGHMYTMRELHRVHGPIVRIAPNNVSIADSAAIKSIYSPSAKFTKSEFYDVMNFRMDGKLNEGNIFAVRDEAKHTEAKRQFASLYSPRKLLTYEKRVDETSHLFFTLLNERFAKDGVKFNLGEWLQFYAFDVVAQITFSDHLGFLREGKDIDGVIHFLYTFNRYSSTVAQYPILHSLLLANPIVEWLSDPTRNNPVINFVQSILKERNDSTETNHVDMIQDLNEMRKNNPEKVPAHRVVDMCAGNILAGSDTTGIALRALLHLLLTNPRCYKKLRDEIDEKDKEGALSSPIQMNEASDLPFLQACLKESMRMHPSVGMSLERLVPKGGATICDRYFPEGTVVGVNPFVVGRDTTVYGDDVDVFRPERWIGVTHEQNILMERNLLAFGAGKRLCLGKHVSLLEMTKLVPELIRRFDIQLEGSENLEILDYWFSFQRGLTCSITARAKSG